MFADCNMASRGASSRRRNVEGKSSNKNTEFSNKNIEHGKKGAYVTNRDVQQTIPSTGPSKNNVEQCTAACVEPPKSKMECRSTEQESLGYAQNLSLCNCKNTLDYASMTLQTARAILRCYCTLHLKGRSSWRAKRVECREVPQVFKL